MDNFNLKKYITEGRINITEKEQTLNDFISAAEAYLKAGGAADEYVSDEKIKKTAQFLYNQYLQGVNIEDLFENSDNWRHHILSDNEAKALIKNLGLELEDAGNINDPENGPSMEDSYYEVYAGKYKGHTIRIDYSSDIFGSDWDLTLFDESQLDIVGDE